MLVGRGACAKITYKTHVFDVAGKVWALPLIATHAAKGPHKFHAPKALKALIARMTAPNPEARPNFTAAIAILDRARRR